MLELIPFSLRGVIENSLDIVAFDADKKKVNLYYDPEESGWEVGENIQTQR